MLVGVPKETFPGESRVALIPVSLKALSRAGVEAIVERGAGLAAGFTDEAYSAQGYALGSRDEVFQKADAILQVRSLGANPEAGQADLARMRQGQAVIGFFEPLTAIDSARKCASAGVSQFSMELMPRITRAQSMDALSSMATIAGYKAVLLAADALPKMFPMMMTAAGTITPAKVFIVGAGVAGLQAIASARRMGAIVEAYDVRPAVKEQVESLGGKFVEMELDATGAEDKDGYAKELGEDFYRRQREMMTRVIAENDVVITTAAVPGKKAPVLVTRPMVEAMAPGSVIVDLAAERGGNCELTEPGKTVDHNGVRILGPLNLPTTIPQHASQMYAKNITTFLTHMVKDGKLELDLEDEIVSGTLVAHGGEIVHVKVAELARVDSATGRGLEE